MTKISKLMATDIPKINKNATVSAAAELMAVNPHSCIIVMDGNKPMGIVTESDILKNLVSKKRDHQSNKIVKIMSSPITFLSSNMKLEKAGKIIDTKHFRRYPVERRGSLVGIVTENGIMEAINRNIRFHRTLQNAIMIIFVIFEIFIFLIYEHIIIIFN